MKIRLSTLILAAASLPAACLGATEYINSNSPSPLEIAVKDSATPGVWVNQPDGRTNQYYSSYSWGTIIWLNGTNTGGRYTTGYQGSPTTNSPVSNTKTGSGTTNDPYVITTVVKLGTNDVYVNQRFSYVNGDRYFTKNWVLTNSGTATFTDLRLFHGGDAFFGGIDSARSWWDDVNQKIYLSNSNFVNCGYMAFYPNPATPVVGYYGGYYDYGNIQADTLAQLSNTADSAYRDAGYYLQWNKTSLAPGNTWTIEAYEYWSLPGSLAVLPAANDYVEADSTVTQNFLVHNLSATSSATVGMSVTGADWAVSLPDGTNLALAALAVTSVNVQVVVPAGVAADVTKDITLTALSGINTGTGSSRLTVYVPTFTITPNPLDFGSVLIGSTNDLTITLSNAVGGAAVTVGTIADTLDAPFSIVADNASGQTVAPGGSCSVTVRFAPTSSVASADSFNWPIVSPVIITRTIAVQGTGGTAADGWLAINVTPTTGSWSVTVPAGYTNQTSGTGSLAAVSAPTGAYVVVWGPLAGYLAPAAQTQVVLSASTSLFTGVYTLITTNDGWLAVNVTPTSGSWQLSAPAGYTGPTSGTGSLAAVSAVTGQYGISYSALSGYVAPSNQTGFVTGGNTTLFSAVYLQISTNIGTPSGVNATEGAYTNKIRVTWNSVTGATGYEIWRSQTNDADTAVRIADIPLITIRSTLHASRDTYYYDDYNINPVNAYYYWVRAKTDTLISPMSYVGMGYAALSPDQKTGTADIGASDMVYLPVNVTNLSQAGTVSFRVMNYGPDALASAGLGFDFHMGTNLANMVWIGSAQSNMTLSSGEEILVILGAEAKHGLIARGDLSGLQTVQVTVRHLSTLYDPNLANNTTIAAGTVRIKTNGVNSIGRALNDYDGDGKSDGCLYHSVLGRWYGELSGMRYSAPVWIGDVGMGWMPVPGDYDGDGITDVAAYNSVNGQWLVRFSSDSRVVVCEYGGPGFTATQSDIDGDAKTDLVMYRETDGYWMGAASSRGYISCYTYFGETGYQPVMADYDGDSLADPAVYNEETGIWGLALSGAGYQATVGEFGGIGYLPAPADYDGDGLTDPAIYAPPTAYWQVLLSGSLATQGMYTWWGGGAGNINGIPVPADYDGDGKADLAVYHQDSSLWELFLSTRGYLEFGGDWGGPEYMPARE